MDGMFTSVNSIKLVFISIQKAYGYLNMASERFIGLLKEFNENYQFFSTASKNDWKPASARRRANTKANEQQLYPLRKSKKYPPSVKSYILLLAHYVRDNGRQDNQFYGNNGEMEAKNSGEPSHYFH